MAQTAQRVSQGHSLYINSNITVSDVQSFPSIDSKGIEGFAVESRFLKQQSVFHFHNRLRISFAVDANYHDHFALLRGLIEFNRTNAYSFTFNRIEKTIEADIRLDQGTAFGIFMNHIGNLLEKEIKFKSSLKQVLAFEQKFKQEKEAIYKAFLSY